MTNDLDDMMTNPKHVGDGLGMLDNIPRQSEENITENPKGGPKPKPIDPDLVFQMAKMGCTMQEMAYILGVSHSTISRRFGDIIKEGFALTKMSLRRTQLYKALVDRDNGMLVWLDKKYLMDRQFDEDVIDVNTTQTENPIQNVVSNEQFQSKKEQAKLKLVK